MVPPLHPDEKARLSELYRYGILDTEPEVEFDELVELASEICDVPVAVVNFIDQGRQWFKAEIGLGVRSTPIDTSLCGHAILQGDFVEIPDTLEDSRMSDNPLCTGQPGFRFYAGAVLKGFNGLPLGTLCVLDHRPRVLSEHQRKVLRVLSRHVMRELDLRIALEQEQMLRQEVDHRVKNSLASIGALLSMKARKEDNVAARMALEDASSRIRSISSLHAEMHDLASGELADLQSLFNRIEVDLRHFIPDGIQLSIDVPDHRATPVMANALLLIANEFVSNSVKHGLKSGQGIINIVIQKLDDNWSIICRDNGTGTELDAARAASASGLGTRVIQSLTKSLGFTAQWRSNGTGMELTVAGSARDRPPSPPTFSSQTEQSR